jgi:hypothetical protein
MKDIESIILKDNEILILRVPAFLSLDEHACLLRSIPESLDGRVLIVDSSVDVTTVAKESS